MYPILRYFPREAREAIRREVFEGPLLREKLNERKECPLAVAMLATDKDRTACYLATDVYCHDTQERILLLPGPTTIADFLVETGAVLPGEWVDAFREASNFINDYSRDIETGVFSRRIQEE